MTKKSKLFNDFYPNSDEEVINIVLKYLGNDKKILIQNYTKNDFEVIKKHCPLFWSYVKNKSFTINGKPVNFFELGKQFILINRKKIY